MDGMKPLTLDHIAAIGERRAALQVERPCIYGRYDNGKHSGVVEILGTAQGGALVRKYDSARPADKQSGPLHRVSLDALTVDADTHEHLSRAVKTIFRFQCPISHQKGTS